MGLTRHRDGNNYSKNMKEASTSMEDLHVDARISNIPGTVSRPKSMCVPDSRYYRGIENVVDSDSHARFHSECRASNKQYNPTSDSVAEVPNVGYEEGVRLFRVPRTCDEPVSLLVPKNFDL